jgi:hypothetical protein
MVAQNAMPMMNGALPENIRKKRVFVRQLAEKTAEYIIRGNFLPKFIGGTTPPKRF